MKNIIKKILNEMYYDSRKEVNGYVDAEDLNGQRLWFHTNRTHEQNGWNGMIGIYNTSSIGRKTGLAGQYTNEVRVKSPIYFQTSEKGSDRIKRENQRSLIAGVSGIVIDTDSGNISGMVQVTYNPFDVGYFHEVSDSDKKEIVSASECYFNASEDGEWGIYIKEPVYR